MLSFAAADRRHCAAAVVFSTRLSYLCRTINIRYGAIDNKRSPQAPCPVRSVNRTTPSPWSYEGCRGGRVFLQRYTPRAVFALIPFRVTALAVWRSSAPVRCTLRIIVMIFYGVLNDKGDAKCFESTTSCLIRVFSPREDHVFCFWQIKMFTVFPGQPQKKKKMVLSRITTLFCSSNANYIRFFFKRLWPIKFFSIFEIDTCLLYL